MKDKKVIIIVAVIIVIVAIALIGVFSNKGNKNNNVTSNNGTTTSTITTTQEDIQKQENKKGKDVKLGETIEDEYIKMTLDTFEVEAEYKFRYETKGSVGTSIKNSGIEGKSGMKLVCLRGKLTNKTSSDVYTSNNFVKGEMTINGNKYKTTLKCFDTEHAEHYTTMVAQQEAEYFLYAEVPENVADNIESCNISFGWVKDLDSRNTAFATNISDLDYIYTLQAK